MTFPFGDSVSCLTCLLVLLFKKEKNYHEQFCGTLHVLLSIEHLAIDSAECFVCWRVLWFRERNNFIQLSKNISLYSFTDFQRTKKT